MLDALVLTVHLFSIVIAVVVFWVTWVRAHRSAFRIGLLVYLAGTALWSIATVSRVVAQNPDWEATEAWIMPATALVVAGVRIGFRALAVPGWKPARIDFLGFSLHPFMALVVASVWPLHGYVVNVDSQGKYDYGPVFWVHVALSIALLVLTTSEVVRSETARELVTGRYRFVFASFVVLPALASYYAAGIAGPMGLDPVPWAFAVTSLILWRTVVPYQVVASAPIARSKVFEEIADAVFVLDHDGVIRDANPAALALAHAPGNLNAYKGRSLVQLWPHLAVAAQRPGEHDVEIAGQATVLDVTVTALRDGNGARLGTAVVMRDVTMAVNQRRELARLRAELAELVVRDVVTGLHNRRYADQALPEALARCRSKGTPMSVVVLDVDHFKAVNDTYGHSVGDRVLHSLARVMLGEVPASSLARVGGEEFLVMLPGLNAQQAFDRAERLRQACANVAVATREGAITVSVSAGVATSLHAHGSADKLIDDADRALYEAKRSGRDRTCAA